MRYKAVLLDLDGTLLDSLEDLADAANRVLLARGFPTHTVDSYRYFVGDGPTMLITRTLPENQRDGETIGTCVDAYLEQYRRNWKVKTKPYEGVAEMLDELTERRLKLAVLSNKRHEFTERCVSDLLPNWTFDVVLGERDGVPRKPDPTGALEVAAHVNVPPADFIYLGDSAVDMKCAISADMFPVGALWGYRSAAELQESGAQALIKHPLEILDLLD